MSDVIEQVRTDPEKVIREVYDAASRIEKASEELASLTQRFESAVDEDGQISYGIKLRYENALDNELLSIVDRYEEEGKRPPAEDIRLARAKRHVRLHDEQLYVEYVQAEMEMNGLRRYISSQKAVVSGLQSALNGLKAIGA